MKYLIFLFTCLCSVAVKAQKMPDYGLDKVRITQADQTIVAELEPASSGFSAKPKYSYYWYSSNTIHQTQGGYSGRLLNGLYTAFYPNKNLKEQGHFKKGLKDGIWKTWAENGTLTSVTTWKHGLDVTGRKPPIWKRLPLLHKKKKATDSVTQIQQTSKH